MSRAAWPFLVGRNRALGYQVVVSPQFLSVNALSYLLTQIAGGDESPPAGATAREIRISGAGKFTVIFRVVKPQAQEYDVGGTDVLRDAGGRPIRLIEGFVVQGGIRQLKRIILTQEDLQMAHDQVKEAYRAFWSADEIASEWTSMPFDLKTPTSAHDQITLKVEAPLEVPRPSGRRHIADPSMRNRLSRRLQVLIAASFILLVLIAVAIIYLLLAHTLQFFRQLRWEVLFYYGIFWLFHYVLRLSRHRLVKSVKEWMEDPDQPARQVGWVWEESLNSVRPVPRLALRCKSSQGQWRSGVLLFAAVDHQDILTLMAEPPGSEEATIMRASAHFYDQRAGGIETSFGEEKGGLGIPKRNKKRFEAQRLVMLLGTLAQNLLIWAGRWLCRTSPQVAGRLRPYAIKRMLRDLYPISAILSFDRHGRLRVLTLPSSSSLAHLILVPLQKLLALSRIAVILDQT